MRNAKGAVSHQVESSWKPNLRAGPSSCSIDETAASHHHTEEPDASIFGVGGATQPSTMESAPPGNRRSLTQQPEVGAFWTRQSNVAGNFCGEVARSSGLGRLIFGDASREIDSAA